MERVDTKASVLLTKFSDRWDYMDRLFKELDTEIWKNCKDTTYERRGGDEHWPRREWTHAHSGPQIGWDQDHIAGLHDYWQPYANHRAVNQPEPELQGTTINDSVTRDKIYIYNEGFPYSEEMLHAFPSLKYFIKMRDAFEPEVLKMTNHYADQDIAQFKPCLMLVKYDVPDFVDYHSYMHWNFYKFGGDHADDNLGALHLGENQTAFYVKDDKGKRNFTELKYANTLWTWGDFAKESGITPTTHGVEYFGGSGPRYSIIYNLECDYN